MIAAGLGSAAADTPLPPPQRQVAQINSLAAASPRLEAAIRRAPQGWDITLALADFQFPGDRAAATPRAGEGHVELYVDNKRVRSLFETSAHVDPLPAGTHEIRLALVGNDGKALVANGAAIARRFVVWVPRLRSAAAPAGTLQALDLNVVKGKVANASANATFRVTQGDTLQLTWTVDEAVQIHFHGYDIETRLDPGQPVVMLLPADLPGRFAIETHAERGKPAAALHYIEVYPR